MNEISTVSLVTIDLLSTDLKIAITLLSDQGEPKRYLRTEPPSDDPEADVHAIADEGVISNEDLAANWVFDQDFYDSETGQDDESRAESEEFAQEIANQGSDLEADAVLEAE